MAGRATRVVLTAWRESLVPTGACTADDCLGGVPTISVEVCIWRGDRTVHATNARAHLALKPAKALGRGAKRQPDATAGLADERFGGDGRVLRRAERI